MQTSIMPRSGLFVLTVSLATGAPAQAPLPFVLKQVAPGIYAAIDGPPAPGNP